MGGAEAKVFIEKMKDGHTVMTEIMAAIENICCQAFGAKGDSFGKVAVQFSVRRCGDDVVCVRIIQVAQSRASNYGEDFVLPIIMVVTGAGWEVSFAWSFRSKVCDLVLMRLSKNVVLCSHDGFKAVEGREED